MASANPRLRTQKAGTVRTFTPTNKGDSDRIGKPDRNRPIIQAYQKAQEQSMIQSDSVQVRVMSGGRSSETMPKLSPTARSLSRDPNIELARTTLATKQPALDPSFRFGLKSPERYAQEKKIPYYTEQQQIPTPSGRYQRSARFVGFTEKQALGQPQRDRAREQRIAGELEPIFNSSELKLPTFMVDSELARGRLRKEGLGTVSVLKVFETNPNRFPGESKRFFAGSVKQPVKDVISENRIFRRDPRNEAEVLGDAYNVRAAFTSRQKLASEIAYNTGGDVDLQDPRVLAKEQSSMLTVGFMAGAAFGAFEGAIRTGAIKPSQPSYERPVSVPKQPKISTKERLTVFADKNAREVSVGTTKGGITYKSLIKVKVLENFKGSGIKTTGEPKLLTYKQILKTNLGQKSVFKLQAKAIATKGINTTVNLLKKPLTGKRAQTRLISPQIKITELQSFQLFGKSSFGNITRIPPSFSFAPFAIAATGTILKTNQQNILTRVEPSRQAQITRVEPKFSSSFDLIQETKQTPKQKQSQILINQQETQTIYYPSSGTPTPRQNPIIPVIPGITPKIPSLDFGRVFSSPKRARKTKLQSRNLTPQFAAVVLDIKGRTRKTSKYYTGFELRGL